MSLSRSHKSVTYDRVRQVISLPPDRRKDFEVNNILPWFSRLNHTKVLGQLKHAILFDVIRNVQFITKAENELLIRQGDQGDCMYVLLRGQVTVYHTYDAAARDGSNKAGLDDVNAAASWTTDDGYQLRQQLGASVVTLNEPGAAFGEVALLTDNGTRSASVIADEPTDLIVIDRALYLCCVQDVISREFEQKASFIAQHAQFRHWAPKYRKQLSMALEKEVLSFDYVLTKQGDPVDAIYFVLSGEVKLTMDHRKHVAQFPKIFADAAKANRAQAVLNFSEYADNLFKTARIMAPSFEQRCNKQLPIEICILGINEAIGEVEALMGLPTYIQTCKTCTHRSDVLVLSMRHYERLLVRRNPRTVDAMRRELELRISARVKSRYLMAKLPFIGCLLSRARDYNQPDRPPTSPLRRQLITNQLQKRSSLVSSISSSTSASSRPISTTQCSVR